MGEAFGRYSCCSAGGLEGENTVKSCQAHILTWIQIRRLSFTIIRSTTITLPAWRATCEANELKPNLIPCDVATRWNSTYDMMRFVLKYWVPIDSITANKSLKLWQFELDNEDWKIIGDLVSVLEVSNIFCVHNSTNN